MMPLYVLYDLRVAYSHLTSKSTSERTLRKVCKRLSVPNDVELGSLYHRLTSELMKTFEVLTAVVESKPAQVSAEKSRTPSSKKTAVRRRVRRKQAARKKPVKT
jgi:hypothetical protein